jgi:phosphomannomutase
MTTMPLIEEDPWKPCDLRGVYPDAVSPQLFTNLGGAVGTTLSPGSRVVAGGDFRLSTPELKRALCNGLMRTGVHVLDIGQGPTPLAYFAAQQVKADAVLMVTASHNPAGHNGLKLMLGSTPTSPNQVAELRALTESRAFRSGQGSIQPFDPRPRYIDAIANRWRRPNETKGMHVILDAGNGAWSEMAPAIMRLLGFDVDCISCVVDGNFPDRSPDCASAANLGRLRQAVREQAHAIGVAWDGDGDRVAFVDEESSYVPPDEIALLLAQSVLRSTAAGNDLDRKIVVDAKCSDVVRREIVRHGGSALLERTGHAFMRRRMVTEGALLGLDACGHYFFGELQGGDDGLFAALFVLNVVQSSGQSLAALRRELPRIYSTPELRIPVALLSLAEASMALNAAFPHAEAVQTDGFRLVMKDGIVLVRESGTEPVLSLRIEGFTSESYRRILAQCLQSLPAAAPQFQDMVLESSARSN